MASSSSSATSSPIPVVQVEQQQQQQDRFGALSRSILLHILSFLPTLHAVRTSVLSTRWRTLWTSVGALDLDEGNRFFSDYTGKRIGGSTKRKRKSKSRFAEFVGKVLSFHQAPTLHKLRLVYLSKNCPLNRWVRKAVSRRVQTLDLRLPSTARRLPPLLFASQSLVDLRLDLSGSELILPETMALVGLRRVRLCRVKFSEDHSTRALVSSSTALRSLALENCDYRKLSCLEISHCSLQELAIEDDLLEMGGDLGNCQVKIAAPHLSSFVYRASVAQAYVVEPLSCVDYVKIQFKPFGAQRHSILDPAGSLFSSLSSVRNLDICPIFFEAMRFRRTIDPLYAAPFRNLNVLRTTVKRLDYMTFHVVMRLWLLNPQLRTLIVEVRYLNVLPSLDAAEKEDFLELLGACFESGIDGVLERVEIRCSADSTISGEVVSNTTETVLELVRVLLGSQTRLKKLILSNVFFCGRYSPNRKPDAVMEKVMSFPKRSSGQIAVMFI